MRMSETMPMTKDSKSYLAQRYIYLSTCEFISITVDPSRRGDRPNRTNWGRDDYYGRDHDWGRDNYCGRDD
jgi:hypothetical protein